MPDNTTQPGALPTDAEGFAFLDGIWRVHHRKSIEPLSGREAWKEFEGRARFFTLLDGLVSIEEMRGEGGMPMGGALRAFDRERRMWSDQWVGARDGLVQSATWGRFDDDIGTFTTEDMYQDKPMLVRGIWRRVSPDEVTWEQLLSLDNGASWELDWHMRFVREGSS